MDVKQEVDVKDEPPSDDDDELEQEFMKCDVYSRNSYNVKIEFNEQEQLRNEEGDDQCDVAAESSNISQFCNEGNNVSKRQREVTETKTEIIGLSYRRHHNDTIDKPFKCEVCCKTFHRKPYLMKHMRNHTDTISYECKICHKTFKWPEHLRGHIMIHTGEKPFECDMCDRKFSRKSHLRDHRNKHNGIKPFQCEVCRKTFSQLSNLYVHQTIHTGDRPHVCDICNKTFGRISTLKRHKQIHESVKILELEVPIEFEPQPLNLTSADNDDNEKM